MCNCNSRTDVRARCCPIKDRQKFKICGERVHTAYYMMMADYELSCKQIDHRKSNKYNEKCDLWSSGVIDETMGVSLKV
jgi:hypothetical protein